MESIFSQVLNMSLTGSLVIVLVLLARLALRRAPKVFSYALWSVVLFRLLCPVALTGPASVLSPLRPQVRQTTGTASVVTYLPVSRENREPAQVQQTADEEPAAPDEGPDLTNLAAKVWAVGALGLLLWSFAQYFLLRLRLLDAVRWRRNVYLAEGISTAFVMGYLAPKIYLPFHVPKQERRFILAHERCHLRRGDHLVKLLAYLALCVHWFNPLAWVAFLQAGKDMEMSCDEAVLRRLGPEIRADYASALLRLSASRRIPAGMPLAFGEGDTKGRIMNMAKWKKPRRWVSAICLVLCAFVLMACAVNPMAAATGGITVGQLPEGLTYTRDGRDLVFTQDGQTVGGVTVYDIPEGAYDPGDLDWPAKVGIPDYQAEGLWRMSEGSVYPAGEAIDVEFGSDVPPGEEATEHRRHTLVKVDDTLYDIWMDRMKLDSSTCYALLSAVKLPGVDDVTFTVPETIPASALPIFIDPLPDGYAYTREGSGIRFTKDGATIGGVDRYVLAEGIYDPADEYFDWLANVGIPDYEDDSLAMMGSISGQDKREWIVVFSSDVPQGQPVTVERRHHFTVEEPMLYDIWFDALAVDMETIGELYNAVILPTA